MRSVTHSTGAWSSVHGSSDGSTGAQLRARAGARAARARADGAARPPAARVSPTHDVVEAQRRPAAHLRELGRERAREPAREAVVVRHRGHVERDEPARPQALAHEPKNSFVAR